MFPVTHFSVSAQICAEAQECVTGDMRVSLYTDFLAFQRGCSLKLKSASHPRFQASVCRSGGKNNATPGKTKTA